MTQRTGQWIIGACLCAGLLPGCALTNLNIFRREKAVDPQKIATKEQLEERSTGYAWQIRDPAARGRAEFDSPYNRIASVFPGPRTDPRFVRAAVLPDSPEIPDWPQSQQPPGQLPITHPSEPVQQLPQPQPEAPLVRALSCLVKGDHQGVEVALAHLERYDQPTQHVIGPVLLALARLNGKSVEQLPPEELTVLQYQLEGSLLELRARSKLIIQEMCLCEQIEGFGQYKPLDPEKHQFLPACKETGRPGELVQIYVEVRNVGMVPHEREQVYETKLSGTVEITNESGHRWARSLKGQNPQLRSPIMCSECFQRYCFYVPSVPPGRYTLRLTVTDDSTTTPRHATVKLRCPFIVAPSTVCSN